MGAFSNYGKTGSYFSDQNQVIDIDPWFTDLSYTGTSDNDLYSGRGGDDTIWGMLGHDKLYGAGGNDTLYGNAGHDWLSGDEGNDFLDGGSGNDFLYGGAGADVLLGGSGRDHLMGDEGEDYLYGGAGHDWVFGGEGMDVIYGEAGNDILDGGDGEDYIDGGDGDDVITGGGAYSQDSQDVLTGGGGSDTFVFAPGDAQIDIFTFVGNTIGNAADTITDFDTATDFISGFGDAGSYQELATTAVDPLSLILDPYFLGGGDTQGTIFFYNESTDTGYLYHNSEVIVLEGCGSADDFSGANLI